MERLVNQVTQIKVSLLEEKASWSHFINWLIYFGAQLNLTISSLIQSTTANLILLRQGLAYVTEIAKKNYKLFLLFVHEANY
jgi:hypothetical protein